MSTPQLGLQPSFELAKLLVKLGQNPDFEKLMLVLKARRDGLGVWAHSIPTEPYKTWASGRVQELAELVALFDGRHELLQLTTPKPASPNAGGEL